MLIATEYLDFYSNFLFLFREESGDASERGRYSIYFLFEFFGRGRLSMITCSVRRGKGVWLPPGVVDVCDKSCLHRWTEYRL